MFGLRQVSLLIRMDAQSLQDIVKATLMSPLISIFVFDAQTINSKSFSQWLEV